MALAALLAAVAVLSIAGQAQHAPGQVTVLSPEPYPLAGGTWPIPDLAASALLPGYAFAQSVTLNPTAADSITNSSGAPVLGGSRGIATFTSDGRTYAAVAAYRDNGVQILDVTDPYSVTAAGSIVGTTLKLGGARSIATFTSGGSTYAAVAASGDDGVQILNVTDPYSVTAAGSITDSSGDLELKGPRGIAVFVSGNSTYAAVAAYNDNGVQILDVTDPSSITAAGKIDDNTGRVLHGAWDIATFTSGGSTYAAVATSGDDDGVQILNVTDPYSVTAAGSIAITRDLELDGARGIAIFNSTGGTYAAVAAAFDGVQILNITNPYSVTAAGSITNSSDAPVLGRPWGIATFTSGGSAYAAVAASDSNGVQILDVTDPSSITAAGSITDVSSPALGGAQAIAIFNSTGGTYAAVAAFNDDGVQIIHLAGNNVPTVDAGPDQTVSEGDPVSLPWSASDEDGDALMYAWSQSPADPAITLISPDLPPTTFTAPPVDSKTVIALTLTVSDGIARSSDTLRVTITDPSDIPLTAAGSIIDTDALRLKGASGVAVFASGGRTYAAVAAFNEGVQILDVTDPYSVTAAGSIADDDAPELRGAGGIATFESGGGTYAAVAASTDSGVQILDVTDPYSVTAAGSINNTGALELDGPQGIAIFESGGGTYAAVAAHVDDSIQILDVSNPYSVTAAGSINNTDALELSGPAGIAIFESGGSTYAAVAALEDDGVQILNITDPSSITAAGSITNTDDLKLDGARGIAVFVSGNSTYAAVAANADSAVQILNITDPSSITAAGSITNTDDLKLQAPRGIAVFVSGNSTYAAVTAFLDDGIQILDVTDPSSITAAGRIGDNSARVLHGAWDIATFTSGGSTYAAVAASGDDGVQIIRLTGDAPQVVPNSPPTADAGPDLTFIENSTFTLAGSATDPDDDALMYAWSQDPPDSGVTFDDDTSLAPTVTLPPVAADTTVTLTLEVRDDSSAFADSLALTVAEADGSFITTWTTTGADQTITIPVGGHGGTYTAVWGDGGTSAGVTGDTDHGYAEAGTYTVSVSGDFARFHLDGDSDNAPKLASIEQWGDARWISMEGAFRGAANVEYKAADAPDLSGVTSMKTMFIRASSFNGDLSSWDVSRVEDMEQMFESSSSFNGDLSSWDVSRVTDMRGMFLIASAFNQDISSWDVSRVTDMRGMFLGASAFNRDISIWNVSGVEGMESMFGAPSSFDQNLGRWYVVPADASFDAADTSLNVTTISAQNAFLDGHNPAYGIGSGHNSTLFNMTGSTLMFKGAPDPGDYMVSVTASGGGVFSSGNNWRVLNVTVTDQDGGTSPDGAFVTTWDPTFSPYTISIPLEVHSGGTLSIDWGDGNTTTVASNNTQSHTYAAPGKYQVSMTGDLARINLGAEGSTADKLTSIDSWGNVGWSGMKDAFRGAFRMASNATDAPDLSGVTDMSGMFRDAASFDQPLADWNVSSVTDMSGMFRAATSFNQDISSWNVSSVTDMSGMFLNVDPFDQPLADWNVSSVTDMSGMFNTARDFNQPLADWNVSSVTDMSGMFRAATSFDQPLADWNVSSVTDMSGMFRAATSFDQPLADWNVSSVTDMSGMFNTARDFNQPLADWNVSSVTDMSGMFNSIRSFNQPLADWNVSSVTDMSGMFRAATSFDQPLADWNVSSVTDMSNMFSFATSFDQPLAAWDVSSVTDMSGMFEEATSFDQPLADWDVSSVTDMSGMFLAATSSFDQNLGRWYVVPADASFDAADASLNVTTISAQNSFLDGHSPAYGIGSGHNSDLFSMTGNTLAFKGAPDPGDYMVSVTASGPDVFESGNNWRVLNVTVTGQDGGTSPDGAFVTTWDPTSSPYTISIPLKVHSGGTLSIDWGDGNTTTVTSNGTQSHAYAAPGGVYRVSMTGDLARINLGAAGSTANTLTSIDSWGDVGWSSMKDAFRDASDMVYNATDAPDLSGVADMSGMFQDAGDFDGDLSGWNVSSVTDMSGMLQNARAFNQPLADWNVSSVTDMSGMLQNARAFNQSLADWNVSSVTDMSDMFRNALVFDQPLAAWNVSSVTDMSDMFNAAISFDQPLAAWNVSSVTDMSDMFNAALSFNQPLADWDVSSVTDMSGMFWNARDFDQTLNGWDISSVIRMGSMFSDASAFDGDISGWNVSSVVHMNSMFDGASSFNGDISGWDVSGVEAMAGMFSDADAFDQNLGRWYVVPADASFDAADASLNVTTISAQNSFLDGHSPAYGIGSGHDFDLFSMTGSTLAFKGVPSSGDYAVNVTASGPAVFESGNNWRVLNVTVTGQDGGTSPDGAFVTTWDPTFSPYTISIPLDVHSGGTLSIDWGDGSTDTVSSSGTQSHTYAAPGEYRVSMAGDLASINLGAAGSTADKLASIDQWGNISWTTMEEAFRRASSMAYNATDAPDLSGVTDMSGMFWSTDAFNGNLSSWNVSSVTDMSYMFRDAASFDRPLAGWDVSSVTDMSYMFSITASFDRPLAGWDVSSVTDMTNMFQDAISFNQTLADWNVSSVTDMSGMFQFAISFDQPLADWNVSSVTDMSSMFWFAASFNQPLADWNVSSVTDMFGMFQDARAFNQPLAAWNVSSVTDMTNMFQRAASFVQNLGNWYVTLNSTSIDSPDTPGVVGSISAQNQPLGNHNPAYGIGDGPDSGSFEIDAGTLRMSLADAAPGTYTANITAAGDAVFESGNNWRVLNVTVTGSANSPPVVDAGDDQTVAEGATVSLSGTATDDDPEDDLTYEWTHDSSLTITFADSAALSTTFTAPDVAANTTITVTLTANDGTGDGADSLRLTVRDSGSSSGGSSSGGSSSGGSSSGGGGGGAPAAIITDVRIYSVSWDCAAGSVAVTAGPDTDQLSVNIRTSSVGERPVVQAGGELPGTRSFTSAIAGADEFVVVEASLAHEGGHVTTKIVNLRQCVGTVGFDRYEPLQQAVPRPEPEPQELCRDGRAPALRDGNELLCLFPGTFEVLAERGWNLARP